MGGPRQVQPVLEYQTPRPRKPIGLVRITGVVLLIFLTAGTAFVVFLLAIKLVVNVLTSAS